MSAAHPRQSLLLLAVALNAAGAMVVEIVAGRLLAPYFGMSLYTWTTVIGVVLAGLTAGHWIGGHLAERENVPKTIAQVFYGGALTTLLILPLLNLLAPKLSVGMQSVGGAVAISGFVVFFIPSLFAGFVQPLATKLALGMPNRAQGHVIGHMLAAGAFGSIGGTFVAGFVLISYLGSANTIMLVVGVNLLLGLVFSIGRSRIWGGGAGLILAIWAGAGLPAAFGTVCDYESDYYCIQVDDGSLMTGRPSRLMALDHLVHSVNDREDPLYLESPYLHFVDEVVRLKYQSGDVDAFFVGGGAYTLPRAWQNRMPGSRMVVTEVDPLVTQVAREAFWYTPSPTTEILEMDARVALRALEGQTYDVVFGDAFHDIAVPQHLVTHEFNQLVAEHLKPSGLYVLNIIDSPDHMAFAMSMVRTLRQTFAEVQVWFDPLDVEQGGRATFVVLASQSPLEMAPRHRSQYGVPRIWVRLDLSRMDVDGKGMILTDDYVPVDRLLENFWF